MGMAIEVRDISIATIAVSDQILSKMFQKSLPKALEQVLVRISSDARIMTLPVIRDVLPKINNYVENTATWLRPTKRVG